MLRYVLVLLVVIAIVLVVRVGTEPGRSVADLRFISRASVHTVDPALMSYMQDIHVAEMLWEGLTRYHPKTAEPIEGVAYLPPLTSPDGMRQVFTLRSEAKWSNGDPVTAHDFVRGWRRAIEPGTASVYAELISTHIAGAQSYADWRTSYMDVLTVVRMLQKGAPTSAEQAAKAFRSEPGKFLVDLLERKIPDPPPPEQDDFWAQAAEQLQQVKRDWKALGDKILDAHIAQIESRFAEVGIRAIDDLHLEVVLAKPTPYFLDLTAFSTYMPIHHSIELLRERYEGRPLTDSAVWAYDTQWTKPDYHRNNYPGLVTNGPYKLTQWVFRQRMRFEENPYYWDSRNVCSKTIESIDIEYKNTAFMLYEQGLADIMFDLTMDYTPELVRRAHEGTRSDIHAIPSFGTFYLTVNCRPRLNDGRLNPLADARVRRALALSVNRQELVDHVERLGNPVSPMFIPPNQIPGYQSPQGLRYDPQRARQELAEAGYPGGKDLPIIEYLYNTGHDQESPAQAIQRMWERELGIKVQLVGKETKTFAEDKTDHRFMVARGGWFGDYMDPATFLDLLQSENGQNSAGFKDTYYDGLLEAASHEMDPARRLEIFTEAEAYIVEKQLPVIPLYTYVVVYAWKPEVKGIYPNPRNQFPMMYVERKRQ